MNVKCPVPSHCKHKNDPECPGRVGFDRAGNYSCGLFESALWGSCESCAFSHDINTCYDCEPWDCMMNLYRRRREENSNA